MLHKNELVESPEGGYWQVTIHNNRDEDIWAMIPGIGKCVVEKKQHLYYEAFAWSIVRVICPNRKREE